MKKTKILLTYLMACCLTLLLITSCTQDNPTINDDTSAVSQEKELLKKSATEKNDRLEKVQYFKAKMEAGEDVTVELLTYLNENKNPLGVQATDYDYFRDFVLGVINPDEYYCDNTDIPMDAYINNSIADWTFLDYLYWLFYGDYPQIDAIYFKDPSDRSASYGVDGEYTRILQRTFRGLKRFWDINSSDIGMVPMKGTTYADIDRVTEIEMLLYPFQTEEESREWAELWYEIFGSDVFWNFNHPLLSFNAFALTTPDPFIGDRIVMGDGIMAGYKAIGLGGVAPQAILAHEFAHHIQFENGYFEDVAPEDQPNATRRTELMADAYAAYYLTHRRGASMRWSQVEQFLDVFFNIGDCGFSSGGHHGTHNQRMAAAKWGYELSDNAPRNGYIMTSHEFFLAFEAALDGIINCDTCLN